jgi:hypothetical protein
VRSLEEIICTYQKCTVKTTIKIPPERLKTRAENLGIQEHFAFYHDNGQNILHILCLYNYPKVTKNSTSIELKLN